MKTNIVPHKNKAVIAVMIALAGLGLDQAHATRSTMPAAVVGFVSTLDVGNPGIFPAYAPSYGQVSINLIDATHASVTFTSNTVAGNTYLFGGAQGFDLNVNSTSFTASAFLATRLGGGTLGPFTPHYFSNNAVDGWGSFNLQIDEFDGFSRAVDSLNFTLTNLSGSWGSAGDVLSLATGYDAAAHVFVSQFVNGHYVNLGATGFAAETGNSVPDGGATVMLLGGALSVLGIVRRFMG
jgi:hypothetical protein